MKSIRSAMGALVLASLSATAAATTVEIDFLVFANVKEITTELDGVATSVIDTSFQPVSFNLTARVDLADPWQTLYQESDGVMRASARYDPATMSLSPTPFTESLHVPAPAGAAVFDEAGAFHAQDRYAGQHPTVRNEVALSDGELWIKNDLERAGTQTIQASIRNILLDASGPSLSSDPMSRLSSEDTLAFLQTQVGVLLPNAFSEGSWHMLGLKNGESYLETHTILYSGDVLVRAVTVVPEPSTLLMMLLGAAMLTAAHARNRRHAAPALSLQDTAKK